VTEPATTGPPEASAPVFPWEEPSADTGPAPGVAFAPHGPRLAAYLLDTVVLYAILAVLFVIAYLVGGFDRPPSTESGDMTRIVALFPAVIVGLMVIFGYFPFFWARSGQTPGMRPFRLWVVRDRDGRPLSISTALARMLGLFFVSSFFYLGFIWIFIDKRRRGWHDLIAGTVVIQGPHGRKST
jgi:uncharacterized RDD family membrane protein YckC